MHNKRGQGMSVNTIIILILAVIVLVVLILGFTLGWDKVSPWVSKVNVKDVQTACEAACATTSQYDYCSVDRELRDANKNKFKTTCPVFAAVSDFDDYFIQGCNIDCRKPCESITINNLPGEKVTVVGKGYNVSPIADNLAEGEFCIVPLE